MKISPQFKTFLDDFRHLCKKQDLSSQYRLDVENKSKVHTSPYCLNHILWIVKIGNAGTSRQIGFGSRGDSKQIFIIIPKNFDFYVREESIKHVHKILRNCQTPSYFLNYLKDEEKYTWSQFLNNDELQIIHLKHDAKKLHTIEINRQIIECQKHLARIDAEIKSLDETLHLQLDKRAAIPYLKEMLNVDATWKEITDQIVKTRSYLTSCINQRESSEYFLKLKLLQSQKKEYIENPKPIKYRPTRNSINLFKNFSSDADIFKRTMVARKDILTCLKCEKKS